jgi:hypothetical protein
MAALSLLRRLRRLVLREPPEEIPLPGGALLDLTRSYVRARLERLGWRVETGLKYAGDFLLYVPGEARSHRARAGHSVACVRVITDAEWPSGEDASSSSSASPLLTWGWLMLQMRLSSTVAKQVRFVHVGAAASPPGEPVLSEFTFWGGAR